MQIFGRAAAVVLAALALVPSMVTGTSALPLAASSGAAASPGSATAAMVPTSWRSVSAGLGHACAVATDGTLWCWGDNARGDLGNGTRSVGSEVPQQVGTDATWVSVSTGTHTTCGIQVDASLWCWGDNVLGTTGTGSTDPFLLAPRQVEPGTTWSSVATSGSSTCGVRLDGSGWCWGDNQSGQLGTGTYGGSATPVRLGGPAGWRQVVPGLHRGCGVAVDGALWCWGGSTQTMRLPAMVGTGHDWVQVSLSRTDAPKVGQWWDYPYRPYPGAPVIPDGCVRDAAGSVACWVRTAGTPTPVAVPGVAGAASVAVGATSACATAGSGLQCWGFGYDGQLGVGTRLDHLTPTPVDPSLSWQDVSVGDRFACGLAGDASIWCWGRGGLGSATLEGAQLPVRLETPSPVVGGSGPVGGWDAIAPSQDHTCGVGVDHSLWCWGDASGGALGIGPLWWRAATPVQVGRERMWTSVSVTAGYSCALATDATLWCWGHNAYSNGTGTGAPSDDLPTQVLPGSHWTQVSTTLDGGCAVRDDSQVWCWGWKNILGRPGPHRVRLSVLPAPISTPYGAPPVQAQQVSANGGACAVSVDAHLWCWRTEAPREASDGLTWRSVVVTYGRNVDGCAVATDATLRCGWAFELGSSPPVPGAWTLVTAAHPGQCGLHTDASLWCWGINTRGALGTGGLGVVQAPTQVGTGSWRSVTMGDDSTCAVDTAHVGWCWGDNRQGQLGDGTTHERHTPVRVGVAA